MYGIMPLQQYGGSYPYTSSNKQGHTAVNDYCMAVGVMLAGAKANGWSQNANGYDCPKNNSRELKIETFSGDGDRTDGESLALRQPSLPVKNRTLRSQ